MRNGAASDRAILGRSAAFASIATAMLLVGLKLWACLLYTSDAADE